MSPCSVLTLLVPKKDGTYKMCVDSKTIKNITINYKYLIPRLDDMLDEFHGASIFFQDWFKKYEIQMREGDEWKMTFKTKEGLYEWMVMLFGLSNASNTLYEIDE